jgi:hypothetical protein
MQNVFALGQPQMGEEEFAAQGPEGDSRIRHESPSSSRAASEAHDPNDLVMRQYLLDRRPKACLVEEKSSPFIVSRRSQDRDESLEHNSSDSEDEELNEELRRLQLRRLQQIRDEHVRRESMDGFNYQTIVEKEFLDRVLKAEWVVCHFFKDDYPICQAMDKLLKSISGKHSETKFVRIEAEKAKFFTTKLAVKVLPDVIVFHQGVVVDRIIGFEEASEDEYSMRKRLAKKGGIAMEGHRIKVSVKEHQRNKLLNDLDLI